jgi:hypothetical protein
MSTPTPHPSPGTTRRLPRRFDLAALLDTLLICAIATILIVRTELYLTNYPQIGGHGLHIAHLLWGGLLMLISLSILLAFVTPSVRQVAAVMGGIGFGLFIDEVGKFVTADNNYFFKPAATIIYCVFVLAFVIVRQLERARTFTQREYLLNAIEMVKDVPLLRMGGERRARANSLLAHADQSDPLVPLLRQMLEDPRCGQTRPRWPTTRAALRLRASLLRAADQPRFQRVMDVLIGVWVVALVIQVVALLTFTTPSQHKQQVFRLGSHITNVPFSADARGFLYWGLLVSTLIAVVFAVAGLVHMLRGRRLQALTQIERALLVSIFLIQVFAFVHSQFTAVLGLFIDLALFFAVRSMLGQELERQP